MVVFVKITGKLNAMEHSECLSVPAEPDHVLAQFDAPRAAEPNLEVRFLRDAVGAPDFLWIAVEGEGRGGPRDGLAHADPVEAVAIPEGIGHEAIIDAAAGADHDRDGIGGALGIANCRGGQRSPADVGEPLNGSDAVVCPAHGMENRQRGMRSEAAK